MQNGVDPSAALKHPGTLTPIYDRPPEWLVETAVVLGIVLLVCGAIALYGEIARRRPWRGIGIFLGTALGALVAGAVVGFSNPWAPPNPVALLASTLILAIPISIIWAIAGVVAAGMALIDRRRGAG